jgi:hypothetical protein
MGLSGFVCNVHRTTGREPKPLVGATTTIVGDKLYVFAGRRISKSRTQLTSDLYELDLIQRHWTRLECKGEIPPPRYFHSVCALGDTKLVCYGGMSPSSLPNGKPATPSTSQGTAPDSNEMGVMSDVHVYDIPTKNWTRLNAINPPQGRYAHCATILPSSTVFSQPRATPGVLKQNPQSHGAPNQGTLGVSRDGAGGAEMVVVGGQDSANHYIEQISVFNLRSQTWTSTNPLGRSCGAYRSVTAPLSASVASQIGINASDTVNETDKMDKPPDGGSAMLIYSNYNFLDVQLELQIHLHDGTLVEKHMHEGYSPPGLRFPNGGVINGHFVVSGTFLTSYKQEYALWALDLRNLTWSRIDIGSSIFSQGSWNRGILWSRRNAFVILGNRKRSLVEDYNHRRVNFSNICVVELEAFGLYDNPRRLGPMSGYVSASSPFLRSGGVPYSQDFAGNLEEEAPDRFAGGRELSKAAEDLGRMALSSAELSDMDFLAINGEKIPVNSRIVSRRWGPYFDKLIGEALSALEGTDTATLRPSVLSSAQSSRNSSLTITSTLNNLGSNRRPGSDPSDMNGAVVNPASRPRTLYLPHTPLTIQALLHFLYSSTLPPPTSHLCTPQILCSLLQIARPYKIDGLLEAVVERLHTVLDNRNTAAIFNAAAMAAGGGDGVAFIEDDPRTGGAAPQMKQRSNGTGIARPESPIMGMEGSGKARDGGAARPDSDEPKVTGKSSESADGAPRHGDETATAGTAGAPVRPSTSGGDSTGEVSDDEAVEKRVETAERPPEEIWAGSLSSVVGLQKRGLRGLMEGRRMREMGSRDTGGSGGSSNTGERVGLGIERG